MASFTAADRIDWLWGSLKPWQILHSTLAERERCGSALDVWELVNQTLSTSTRRDGQGEDDRGRSHEIQFLGDLMDGDFWRHGGVIETRVKECLSSLIVDQNEESADDDQHLALQLSAAYHHARHGPYHCNAELTIASCSTLHELPSIACKPTADENEYHPTCKVQGDGFDDSGNFLKDDAPTTADDQQEEEDEDDQGFHGYREVETEISRDYHANPNYREKIRHGASILVLDPCCSASVTGAGNDQATAISVWGDDQSTELAGGISRAPPDLEENMEVCAVCLEKLTHYYEEGVQALDCRHAFHTVCIAPWLQRQPHACCPCCRAPIFPDNLAPPLHLSGPVHLAADHRLHAACGGLQEQEQEQEQRGQRAGSNDIMGLLADMEAALERLGFRS